MSLSRFTPRSEEVGRLAVRGGATLWASRLAAIPFTIGATAILARILEPWEFGLVAMFGVVIEFLSIFQEAGLVEATVQREQISEEELSALVWFNAGVGFVLTLLTIAIAPILAWFFNEQRLVGIGLVISPIWIIVALGTQARALMIRELRLERLGLVTLIQVISVAVIGIICALSGLGYWSLVAQQMGGHFVLLVGSWLSISWRPAPVNVRKVFQNVKDLLRFGLTSTTSRLVNYSTFNSDRIILGRLQGATNLGFYTRAWVLFQFAEFSVGNVLGNIAMGVLPRRRDNPDEFRATFRKLFSLLAWVKLAPLVFLGLEASIVVRVLLGVQWASTARIIEYMAVGIIVEGILRAAGWVNLSLGNVERNLHIAIVRALLIIPLFVVAGHFGAIAVASVFSAITAVIAPFAFAYTIRATPLGWRDLVSPLWRPTAVAIIAGFCSYFFLQRISYEGTLLMEFVLRVGGFGIVWVMAVVFVPGARGELMSLGSAFRHLKSDKERTLGTEIDRDGGGRDSEVRE